LATDVSRHSTTHRTPLNKEPNGSEYNGFEKPCLKSGQPGEEDVDPAPRVPNDHRKKCASQIFGDHAESLSKEMTPIALRSVAEEI
jgi:hypothetical protein